MKILPESQIYNLPILEAVLEELRLNIIDHLQYLADAKYLYSLDSLEIKQKLGLLGLSSINIGKFISLNLESDEFEYISPEFYKMYRKLNQHRGNKMSMDYIFHSAGMMNTLVHSNDKYYNATNIFQDVGSFFDFNTYRDNQFPELGVGDGYIIVPYSSNNTQLLKQYLASNPIIFNFLPAGYTFIFFSEYRNSYNTGVLQYDNLLNYLDLITTTIDGTDIVYYVQPIYWKPYDEYDVDEQLIYPGSDEDSTYTRKLYYYDPFYFRDGGCPALIDEYSRFADDSLYTLPFKDDTYTFTTLEEYLAYYAMLLSDSVLTDYEHGLESDLNNQLFFKDVWVGDYLLSYLMGENIEDEYPDHVKGLKAIHSPSYTYASLYERGQSIASQYLQREQGIISKTDTLIQEHKPEIISDRRELDLIKIIFNDVYSLWMLRTSSVSEASSLIQSILDLDSSTADYLANNLPALLKDDIDYTTAEDLFNQFVNALPYHGANMQVCVRNSLGNIVLINEYNEEVINTQVNNNLASRVSVIYRNGLNFVVPPEPEGIIVGGIITETIDTKWLSSSKSDLISADICNLIGGNYITGGLVDEYSPVVPLPTVSLHGDFGSDNWLYADSSQSSSVSVASNSLIGLLLDRSYQTYDDSKSYAVQQWYVNSSTVGTTGDFIISKQGLTQIAAKNVSSSTKYILKARVAICSSNQATVITVYNSNNNPFNAFMYTVNDTDYYYVLDGTQTDWTDDLESIGYIFALELDVGLRWNTSTGTWRSIDLSTDDWYYAGLLSQADADRLTAFGLDVKNVENRSGVIGNVGFNPYYSYKVIAIYSDIVNGQGTGEITFNPSNFYAYNCNYYSNYGYWNALLLEYSDASGNAKGWRVRIEKINPTPTIHTAYTQTDKSARSVAANSVGVDVYDENGSRIPLDSSLIYSVIAYYESSSGDPVQPNGQILLQGFFSSYISISNNITQRTIQRVEYIATPLQPS